MASNRYINTNFWKDNYIADLDPIEKLLFNYFLTNPKTNIAGVYEVNLREVAFDTGIDKDMVVKIVARFQKEGKMYYQNGWLVIRNWLKHQAMNPKVNAGVDRILQQLPDWLQQYVFTDVDGHRVGIDYDSLSIGYIEPNVLNLTKPNGTNLTLLKPNGTNEAEAEAVSSAPKRERTKQIDGMFQYWEGTVGYALTAKVKQNREYAGKLLNDYNKAEIAEGIRAAARASEERYAPRIANFIDLYRKWDDLKLWDKREQKKGAGRATASF